MDNVIALVMATYKCTEEDIEVIRRMNCNWRGVITYLNCYNNTDYLNKPISQLIDAVICIALCNMETAIEKKIVAVTEDLQQQYKELQPCWDIIFTVDGKNTRVFFRRNEVIYREVFPDLLENFQKETGFEICTPTEQDKKFFKID